MAFFKNIAKITRHHERLEFITSAWYVASRVVGCNTLR